MHTQTSLYAQRQQWAHWLVSSYHNSKPILLTVSRSLSGRVKLMWMRLGSGESEVKCPDGWQSAVRFSRLGGIKDNHCLTPKPEANVCVCKDNSESPFTSPDICCRVSDSWLFTVFTCVCVNGLTFSLLKARAGSQHLSFWPTLHPAHFLVSLTNHMDLVFYKSVLTSMFVHSGCNNTSSRFISCNKMTKNAPWCCKKLEKII